MTTTTMQVEHALIARRTRRGVIWSSVVHLVFLVLLTMQRHWTPEPLALTEITWLEPVEEPVAAARPSVAKVEPKKQSKAVPVKPQPDKTVHFKRAETLARAEPKPQSAKAVQDRLQARLAALQQSAPELPSPTTLETQPKLSKPSLPNSSVRRPSPVKLDRGPTPKSAPVRLARAPKAEAPRLELAQAPQSEPSMARPVEDTAPKVRDIAGARLMGPVADRDLVSYEAPKYPETAMSQGLEGSVTLYFIVRPNGTIKENILVQKTSGYADFDKNAVGALRAWRFEALRAGTTGEQWGTITFHYKLSHADWR